MKKLWGSYGRMCGILKKGRKKERLGVHERETSRVPESGVKYLTKRDCVQISKVRHIVVASVAIKKPRFV